MDHRKVRFHRLVEGIALVPRYAQSWITGSHLQSRRTHTSNSTLTIQISQILEGLRLELLPRLLLWLLLKPLL